MSEKISFKRPAATPKLTGTTVAKVTSAKVTSGKFGKQIELAWVSERNTRFLTWINIESVKQVAMYEKAGVLYSVGEETSYIVDMPEQPWCSVTLQDGKLVRIDPLDQETKKIKTF